LKRIPSLDGLRAVSIAAVICSHLLWHGEAGAHALIRTALGRMGVQVFFVVSGFLITRMLIAEREANGRISFGRFFERRALRILPPYVVYVGTAITLAWLVGVPMPAADIAHALTFTMNFASDRSSWALAHGWSLSTEEQFYLAWPALAVFFGWKRVRWLAVVVMLAPLVSFAAAGALPSIHWFPNGVDGIAAGCVLALAWERGWLTRVVRSPAPVAGAALLVARIVLAPYHVGTLLEAMSGPAIALVVARAVVDSQTLIGRGLNARAVVWIGQLSYSLYLWQQLFTRPTLEREPLPVPLAVGCIIACAMLSYYIVERPLLQARARLRGTSAASPVSADAAATPRPARSWRRGFWRRPTSQSV
jgi:peptidoglycan/LPS O-acetylase OafA/YrhL